ncbi:uncharacterized protein LOC763787 isoform X1 [Strongylocentrotus purpuratus]|uniref:SWIM-type domain-containing protein n=1 Tax=Strongylocentrotus purpuratus TaxID=7668 RepID=A0A7M7LIP9_STRPU|nr:uncharacterized protein LOC763787 isoform X1 [Strongylocentrotus purpuratus]
MNSECVCDGVAANGVMSSNLQEILPRGYDYHVCTMDERPGPTLAFTGVVRVNISDEAVAKQWVKEFEESSYCTWRVLRTYINTHRYVRFKKSYKCQHNIRASTGSNENRKTPSKDTKCPTKFTITVKTTMTAENRISKNMTDKHLPQFPTMLQFRYDHNHNIHCAATLRHRDVSKATEEKLTTLFYEKYGPTAALEALKCELKLEYGDQYYKVAGDRSICPDVQYCSRLYRKNFKAIYGVASGDQDMLTSLKAFADQYNARDGKIAVEVADNQVIVAICTPLMQRVHTMHTSSSKLCFMDASSNMDRDNCKVFMLLTHSCVGGLPLGVLITPSETQATITAALQLLQTILPAGCFGGRGAVGPQIFITDDCMAERRALKDLFPQSKQLLCSFHLLKATWRWLWSSPNQIPLADRPNYLAQMKRIIFASTPEETDALFHSSMFDPTLNQSYRDYLASTYSRRHEWACSYRTDLPLRGNTTNNYGEAAMRVLKDRILARTKAVNVAQLADLLSNNLQDYYERRILDVANGRVDHVLSSRSAVKPGDITDQDITKISEMEFEVVSHSVEYHVDTQVGCCTCHAGRTGGSCKHQAAVKHHCVTSMNFVPLPIDVATKILLYRIATGHDAPESGWFAGLQSDSAYEDAIQETQAEVAELSDIIQDFEEDYNLGEPSSPSTSHVTAYSRIDEVKERFKTEFFDRVMEKMDTCPETFVPAVEAMLKQCKSIHADSNLASGMFAFAKDSTRGASARKLAVKRLNLAGTRKIGVQPTATARRRPRKGGKQIADVLARLSVCRGVNV